MCIGVPGRVIEMRDDGSGRAAVGEVEMSINLHLTPEARMGDFVMVHAGTALEVMDPRSAAASLELLGALGEREARAEDLFAEIEKSAAQLDKATIMEVCGTHTTAIARSGIRTRLPQNIDLLSGPGCPVCVTPPGEIDMAIDLALSGQAAIATFGDMLNVPGTRGSLEAARAEGAEIVIVYGPEQALEMARRRDGEVTFLGVGFETTAPLIAQALKEAGQEHLDNFSVLVMHRLIPPALTAVLSDPGAAIDGLLCPGHVSTVIGVAPYEPIAAEFGIPSVVAGFEPLDVLEATAMLTGMLARGEGGVGNQYSRAVKYEGSRHAQEIIDEVFAVVDGSWRGVGVIPDSVLALKGEWTRFDAAVRFGLEAHHVPEPPGCRCGEILGGRAKPAECPLWGRSCLPESPIGPCMVSSEGSCRAAYIYG